MDFDGSNKQLLNSQKIDKYDILADQNYLSKYDILVLDQEATPITFAV